MTIDICVMDAAWPRSVRKDVIEDGSWGSRGTALSILDLLDSGVFTVQRSREIREAIARD